MELAPQEQSFSRAPRSQKGLSTIASMFNPQSKGIYLIQTTKIIQILSELHQKNPKNQGFMFDFNVYELANVIIAQLRNLVRQGFDFKQKSNNLAYAIIRMIQINILWHCYQMRQVKQRGGQLTKSIQQLIQQLRKDAIYCLYNSETNPNKFDFVEEQSKFLVQRVMTNKQKYLKTTRYQAYDQISFYALHQVYLNIISGFRQKIKNYLILPQKQIKKNLFYYCDRIYVKLNYLFVATSNHRNRITIQQLAKSSEQHKRLPSCIYLLDSGSGIIKILNYFEQAPTSAMINDKRFLKIRFKHTKFYEE